MACCLHICHPGEQTIPGLSSHISEFATSEIAAALLPGWAIRSVQYDNRNSLDVQDTVAAIMGSPGPVLILQPIQRGVLADISSRLEGRQLLISDAAHDAATLREAVTRLKAAHDLGQPLLPRLRVVALLMLRKLDREHMWSGNSKGYMWADWIPKGRGLDEQFKADIPGLIFLLDQRNYLVKKKSNGKYKYALNPERKNEIYDTLRNRKFPPEIEDIFMRSGDRISARHLDPLDDYDQLDAPE